MEEVTDDIHRQTVWKELITLHSEMHGIQFRFRQCFLFIGRLPTHLWWCALRHLSIWRMWGRFTLIDVIFIYFWSLSCCVCRYDFWTLCVCRVWRRRPFEDVRNVWHINFVRFVRRALVAVSWTMTKSEKVTRPRTSELASARHTLPQCSRHIHTLFVSIFHEPKRLTSTRAMINDNNNECVPHVTMWVSMNCLRWYMNLRHPKKHVRLCIFQWMKKDVNAMKVTQGMNSHSSTWNWRLVADGHWPYGSRTHGGTMKSTTKWHLCGNGRSPISHKTQSVCLSSHHLISHLSQSQVAVNGLQPCVRSHSRSDGRILS